MRKNKYEEKSEEPEKEESEENVKSAGGYH